MSGQWQRLSDFLSEHQKTVSFVSSLTVAGGTFGMDKTWDGLKWGAFGGSAALTLWGLVLPLFLASRNRANQGRKASQDAQRKVVALVAQMLSAHDRKMDIRAFIMRTVKGGTRRKVDKSTAFGMDSHTDAELEIDLFAGVSGEALRERTTVVGDLTIAAPANGPGWGLHPCEKPLVRSGRKCILATPIWDPTNTDRSLGTLQADSKDGLVRTGFDKEVARDNIRSAADLVALLLKSEET